MPVHKHTRATLGELGDRAADEEARRIVSELGVFANLRVTCRPHSKRHQSKSANAFLPKAPRYLDGHGAVDSLRSADKVPFEWTVCTSYGQWQFEVAVICNDAARRGVPRPQPWPQMVRCAIADAVAREASASTSFGACVSDIDCTFLGAPVRVHLHAGQGLGSGSVVSLKSSCAAGRRWYLIVAHVAGDLWLCADGSIGGGEELTLDRLFADDALQLKNLAEDAWVEPTSRPHKRVRVHVKAPQLRAAVSAHGSRFSSLVAGAKWRAEDIRSGMEGREFDLGSAAAGYKTDPLLWHACGWESQIEVAAAWRWRFRGELHYEKLTSTLNNWPQRRAIPLPRSMQPATESDQEVWEELLRAAEQAATHGFAPRAYLGLRTGEGRYEPDPAKWQWPFQRQSSKYQATVFYEWLYVTVLETKLESRRAP